MKYKILLVSLLSTLAIPYGAATEADTSQNPVVALARLNHQVGGDEAVDVTLRLQTLTETIDSQAASLNEAVDKLTATLGGTPGVNLTAQVAHLAQEIDRDKVINEALRQKIGAMKQEEETTKRALRQVIGAMQDEQTTSNALLHQVLEEQARPPIPQPLPSEVLPPSYPTLSSGSLPVLSSYQQQLLPRRQQIGDTAWGLLGGKNTSLAAALVTALQQNSGKRLEILYLGTNNFTLCIDEEEQYYPHEF